MIFAILQKESIRGNIYLCLETWSGFTLVSVFVLVSDSSPTLAFESVVVNVYYFREQNRGWCFKNSARRENV